MGPINLDILDTPIVEQTGFGPDMIRWLPNIVDIINASFISINNAFMNIIAINTANIGGSGMGPINVSVLGLTSSGYVYATLLSSSNPVNIASVVAGTNQFSITFDADPGASAIIAYQAYTAQPI